MRSSVARGLGWQRSQTLACPDLGENSTKRAGPLKYVNSHPVADGVVADTGAAAETTPAGFDEFAAGVSTKDEPFQDLTTSQRSAGSFRQGSASLRKPTTIAGRPRTSRKSILLTLSSRTFA